MQYNDICDAGAVALARVLEHNDSVTKLDLEVCEEEEKRRKEERMTCEMVCSGYSHVCRTME